MRESVKTNFSKRNTEEQSQAHMFSKIQQYSCTVVFYMLNTTSSETLTSDSKNVHLKQKKNTNSCLKKARL